MKTTFRMPAAIALAGGTALLLAACSTTSAGSAGPTHDMSGMGMSSPSPSPSASAADHSAQDVSFAQGMAMHHLQAVQMVDVLLQKSGVDAEVVALAKRIKAEQQPEITEMNGWLTGWGQMTVDSSMGSMSGMSMGDGMMSQADMDALEKASRRQASTLFLAQMVEHHRGAIAMAKIEIASGADPRAVALARSIVTSQAAEITEMRQLLG